MAKIYNLESELKDLTPVIEYSQTGLATILGHVFNAKIEAMLRALGANHIDTLADLGNLQLHLDNVDTTEGTRVYQIPADSNLMQWLLIWYQNDKPKMEATLTDGYIDDYGNLYFTTGIGYDYLDKDLLGGNGNGQTRKDFFKLLND